MRRLATALTAIAALIGGSVSEASAESRTPGTIFIAELQAGFGIGSVFAETPTGFAGRFTLGAGGKFRGWPTRIYGVANFGFSQYEGSIAGPSGPADTARSVLSWSLGLRLLTPLADNLRLLGDLALGQALVTSKATILRGVERYTVHDDSLLVELGVGLQYRLSLGLSLGFRVEAGFPTSLDSFDLLTELAGGASHDGGRVNIALLVTATLHL